MNKPSELDSFEKQIEELQARIEQLELAAAHPPTPKQIVAENVRYRYANCHHVPIATGYGHTCQLCGLEL